MKKRLLILISLLAPIVAIFFFVSCGKKKSDDPDYVPPVSEFPRMNTTGKTPTIEASKEMTYYTGLLHKPESLRGLGEVHMRFADCDALPDDFDLRTLGTVPEVKDQGQCGSCWSFSKTASLESALLASGQQPAVNLSEQELVSCDKEQFGCQGGLLSDFKYQIDKGQVKESDYPYTGTDSRCKSVLPAHTAKGDSFSYIGAPDRGPTEKELKCALFKSKTVPWITVSASSAWSSPPASEKSVYSRCSNGETNHAVGVVGWWKQPNGKTAFIMKNSWGKSWGDNGYMSMPLGCDSFGEEAAYISVNTTPCDPPKIKLPALITADAGVDVLLGVKAAPEWTYKWLHGVTDLGNATSIWVQAAGSELYKITATNACGTAESSVRVVAQ